MHIDTYLGRRTSYHSLSSCDDRTGRSAGGWTRAMIALMSGTSRQLRDRDTSPGTPRFIDKKAMAFAGYSSQQRQQQQRGRGGRGKGSRRLILGLIPGANAPSRPRRWKKKKKKMATHHQSKKKCPLSEKRTSSALTNESTITTIVRALTICLCPTSPPLHPPPRSFPRSCPLRPLHPTHVLLQPHFKISRCSSSSRACYRFYSRFD